MSKVINQLEQELIEATTQMKLNIMNGNDNEADKHYRASLILAKQYEAVHTYNLGDGI